MFYPDVHLGEVYARFKKDCLWHTPCNLNDSLSFSAKCQLPAIQYFNPHRSAWLNIISDNEFFFLSQYGPENYLSRFLDIKQNNGAIVVCSQNKNQQIALTSFLHAQQVPFFVSSLTGNAVLQHITPTLFRMLAPQTYLHGTFISIFGKGVLLTGPSGIGKSLTALYCLERQHQLIADDAPAFTKVGDEIYGECQENIEGLLEIRQLGIIDVRKLFSHIPYIKRHKLDVVIELTTTQSENRLTELPIDSECINGVEINKISLAFNHNIAILVEHVIRNLYNYPTS